MKWLNYHHLLYFREIAKEGSISKASEKLLVGQPALSTQLKQLEEALGVLLFERKNRSLNLTEAGKTALEYADEIFNKGEEFLSVFDSKNFRPRAKYSLGAIAGLPKALVGQIIRSIKAMESECFVSTFEGENDHLLERLLGHDLDLALTNDPGKPDLDVYRKRMGSSKVSIYGAKKFLKLRDDFPNSLNNAPIILQTMHSKLRYDTEQAFANRGLKLDMVVECQDSAVKTNLAIDGLGLVFLPEFAASTECAEEKLYKIGNLSEIEEEYWLLSAKKLIDNPITQDLLENATLESIE